MVSVLEQNVNRSFACNMISAKSKYNPRWLDGRESVEIMKEMLVLFILKPVMVRPDLEWCAHFCR